MQTERPDHRTRAICRLVVEWLDANNLEVPQRAVDALVSEMRKIMDNS